MRVSRRHFTALLAGLSAAPGLSFAHRELKTHTSIIWNAGDKTLSITHTFHMHDAATALYRAGIIDAPDLMSLKARAKLALYVEESFALKTLDGDNIALDLIGADFEGKSAYVFQQAALETAPTGLSVECQFLQALIPGQVNDVDVNLGGAVRSARFKKGDKAKIILA